jgi:hypothetical protein
MIVAAARIREINISKQAQALRWLRYTDYLLIIVGGSWLLGLLEALVLDPQLNVYILVIVLCLMFGLYTGWRHVGVIDDRVWRLHLLAFPPILSVMVVGAAISLFLFFQEGGLNSGDIQNIQILIAVLVYMFPLAAGGLFGLLSVWRLRRMRIESLGVRLVELLHNLTSQRGERAIDVTKIKRVNVPRGILIGVLGGFILLGVKLMPLHIDPSGHAANVARVMPLLNFLAFYLLIRARRYFQVNADSLLAVDKRNPILFLRSFGDDEKVKFSYSEKAFLDFSLETRLSNHFTWFGPFIAIGSPKETLPEPGAARVLLSDSEWQPRVMTWMSRASLIIMYSGKTHWVNWELGKVIEAERVPNLILMIPEVKGWRSSIRVKDVFNRFELVKDVFKDTKWRTALGEIQDFQKLRALLFHDDGSMTVIKSAPHNRDSYHLAALVAHYIILNEVKQADSKLAEKVPLEPKATEEVPPSSEAKLDNDLLGQEPEKKEECPDETPPFLCPSCGEQLFGKIYYRECPQCKALLSDRCPKCGNRNVCRAYIENGGWGDWCPDCKESLQKMRGEI